MDLIIVSKEDLRQFINEAVKNAMPANTAAPVDVWMNINELCEYLPTRPVKQTIYQKVSAREIPHKKDGKRLLFLKSEIDTYLNSKGRETVSEINGKAETFLKRKKQG